MSGRMASNPADGAEALLQKMAALYGEGEPETAHAAEPMRMVATGMRTEPTMSWRAEYTATRHLHAAAHDVHAEGEDLVHGPVAEIRDTTTNAGRGAMSELLAGHRDGKAALELIGGTRFGSTAALDHADHSLSRAMDRVDTDVAQADRLAKQIEAAIREEAAADRHEAGADSVPPILDAATSRAAHIVEKAQLQAAGIMDAARSIDAPPALLDMAQSRGDYLIEKAQRQAAELVDAAQEQVAHRG